MEGKPSYVQAYSSGLLDERINELESRLSPCILCPRECEVHRITGDLGYCKAPYELYVSSAFPHFGEEAPLVGQGGSGTIFLSHCNLRCLFCQNYEISIYGEGFRYSSGKLASTMLSLQERGCGNINFVTPTHYLPQILRAVCVAAAGGLSIPLVYNCGGYESVETIRLLHGIIDIYMPDIKFLDPLHADRYCRAGNYPDIVKEALREMQRQVGDLVLDEEGNAVRGLIIRHLVMPSMAENTRAVLRFIRQEISARAYVNIMGQYHPSYLSANLQEISQGIAPGDLFEAIAYARAIGLERADRH